MSDHLKNPLWQAEDLGRPVPDAPHAVSVCLPTWADVIGYEEGESRVVDRMFCGYPRFFPHSLTTELFRRVESDLAVEASEAGHCLVFPEEKSANRALKFVRAQFANAGRIVPIEHHQQDTGFRALICACEPSYRQARRYWRFSGEGISSRQAERLLNDQELGITSDERQSIRGETASHTEIRERLAEHAGVSADDVFLLPSGMAAAFTVQRMLSAIRPGLATAQVDFPYVDVLKVQEEFGGAKPLFFPTGDKSDLNQLAETLSRGTKIAGIFGEVPSNPLLRCVDTTRLREIADREKVPLILDDTIGTSININAVAAADVITTSLTKYFSGAGDVLAGSIILVRDRPDYEAFRNFLLADQPPGLAADDAATLAKNSRNYAERVHQINATGALVAEHLEENCPAIEKVYYPTLTTPDPYSAIARPGAGAGGLLSVVLRDGETAASQFFDALRVSKGPSLGTNFSLACPYTLLAHYEELDWAASVGVPRHLVRIAVGLESPDDFISRIDQALAAID